MKLHIPVYRNANFSLADIERVLPGARIVHLGEQPCHLEWENGLPDPLAEIDVPTEHATRLRFLRNIHRAFRMDKELDKALPASWLEATLSAITRADDIMETIFLEQRLEAARTEVQAREDAAEERLQAAGVHLGESFAEIVKHMR